MTKTAQAYINEMNTCTTWRDTNKIRGIRIRFSQDCSAYKLSWSEFTMLLEICEKKTAELDELKEKEMKRRYH